MSPPSETGENKFWESGSTRPLRHVPLRARSRWTFDECAGRRPAIEAVAARPRRDAGANEGLKPRLSRCVAFAALPGAVRRPPRCCDVVLTQISPTRTFWSLAHSYILGGGKLVLKIKMSGAERFWCLRSLLASVASPCARTATWLVSSESPRPALSCRLSHVTLAAL